MRLFNNTENSSTKKNEFYGRDKQDNTKGKQDARVHKKRQAVRDSHQDHHPQLSKSHR